MSDVIASGLPMVADIKVERLLSKAPLSVTLYWSGHDDIDFCNIYYYFSSIFKPVFIGRSYTNRFTVSKLIINDNDNVTFIVQSITNNGLCSSLSNSPCITISF